MVRVVLGCLVLFGCGRTEPVRPSPPTPVYPCELTVEPRALDFGTLSPGGRAARELVVTNTGDGTCALEALTLGASNDPTFSVEGAPWPRTLGPDESVAVSVVFASGEPLPPAVRKGTLQVSTNDEQAPNVGVTLTARVAFCRLTPRPSPYDFGNIQLNTTRRGRVGLFNEGSSDCDVSGLVLEPGSDRNFSLPPQPPGFTVPPGSTVDVLIDFSATDSAPPHLREGHLLFTSNDQLRPQGRVKVSAFINTVCTEAGQFIYTVDGDGRFARFDPTTLSYVDIAELRCPTSSTPFSMNLDQEGLAWIIFADGNMFRVDSTTGRCSATPTYRPGQSGFSTYGMGSVFDSQTGVDTLFLASPASALGTLSFPLLTVTQVGTFPLPSVELAGTGDGQLWAFGPPRNGTPGVLARLDPGNATILEQYSLPTINSVGGWAIKFFGGSFYIFIGSDIWEVERSSLDPSRPNPTRAPTLVLQTPGRDIVGAGVSTCAPTQ